MRTPPANLAPLLRAAAELRAAGRSWEAVASELGRKPDTCRKWPAAYPEVWADLLRRAEDQAAREAGAEARTMLRKLLRSEAEKTSLSAAQALLKTQPAKRKRRKRRPADDGLAAFVARVREVSDAELDALVADALAARHPGGPADGAADPAGPAGPG